MSTENQIEANRQNAQLCTGPKTEEGKARSSQNALKTGIYAKAAIVRASKTGAQDLAMSLAQDLLDCPGLRTSLWPAGEDA